MEQEEGRKVYESEDETRRCVRLWPYTTHTLPDSHVRAQTHTCKTRNACMHAHAHWHTLCVGLHMCTRAECIIMLHTRRKEC
jgi:hypothetical protein